MIDELKKIIDKYDTISFDIFDTLLLRNVYQPTDIFKILACEVQEKYNVDDFYQIRIDSEKEARLQCENMECTFDDIYEIVSKKVNINPSKIKKMELDLENKFIIANPFMKNIFDYAIKKNKKVICISDMYLGKEYIEKLLSSSGYNKIPIYVSNEYKVNKGNLQLFEVARKDLNLDKKKWLHIGDNKIADYDKPLEYGINSYYYENVRTKSKKCGEPTSIADSIIKGIQNNFVYNGNELDYWEKFGILYTSPVYFGFTNWLYNLTKKKDNLYFLSRDGYIISKVYDKFKKKFKNDIYTKYIYSSRLTYQVPAYLDKSKSDFLNTISSLPDFFDYKIKLNYLISSIGLDPIKYSNDIRLFGFSSLNDEVNLNNQYRYKQFLRYIYNDIEEIYIEKKSVVTKYLNQEKINDFSEINIMDVGWGGSTQESIRLLTGKEVVGYYLGTIDSNRKYIDGNSFGYIIDMSKPNNDFQKLWNNVMMWEFIFSAPHGTVLEFSTKNNKIIPVFDETVETSDFIEKIMNSSLKIIDEYLKYYEYVKDISVKESTVQYFNFIQEKNFDDMVHFKDVYLEVLMGTYKKNFVKEFSEDYIINNYNSFISEKQKSIWKDAFIIKGCSNEKEYKEALIRINKKVNNILKRGYRKIRRIIKK